MTRIVAGLARVSTEHGEQDASIRGQVMQLHEAGCDRVFSERASAFKPGAKRPAWEALQALVAAGEVREVVAVSQSRLSRSGDDLAFLRICQRQGVTVRFLDGSPGDIGDPAGRLMAGVMSTVNEVDSLIKSINTKNGLARRKAQGHYACGRVPFGYLYDGSKVVPHPDDHRKARVLWEQLEAFEFNLPGAIRRHRLQWSARGLGRWMRNPILRGIVASVPDAVERLITDEELAAALRLVEARQWAGTRAPRVIRPFSGVVRCAGCDRRMHYAMVHGRPRLKCTNLLCRWYGRGLAEWKVRQQVVEALRQVEMRHLLPTETPSEPAGSTELRQQLGQLQALQRAGVMGLEDAMEALRDQLTVTVGVEVLAPDWEGFSQLIRLPGVLEGATDEELRAVVLELVAEVIYVGDPVRVEVRLRDGTRGDMQQGITGGH